MIDFKTYVEQTMLTEMARRLDLINLDKVKDAMKTMESAGIDLSKYSLNEIQAAFFNFYEELVGGDLDTVEGRIKHINGVMSYWKPSASGLEKTVGKSGIVRGTTDWNYRAYKEKYTDMSKHSIEAMTDVIAADKKKHTVSFSELKKSRHANPEFTKEQKLGTVKKKEQKDEDDE